MCGRSVTRNQFAIDRYFNVRPHEFDRYNVAPSTEIPIIRVIGGERTVTLMC